MTVGAAAAGAAPIPTPRTTAGVAIPPRWPRGCSTPSGPRPCCRLTREPRAPPLPPPGTHHRYCSSPRASGAMSAAPQHLGGLHPRAMAARVLNSQRQPAMPPSKTPPSPPPLPHAGDEPLRPPRAAADRADWAEDFLPSPSPFSTPPSPTPNRPRGRRRADAVRRRMRRRRRRQSRGGAAVTPRGRIIEAATCCFCENGALDFDMPATLLSMRPIKRAQEHSKRICVTKDISDFHLLRGSVRVQLPRRPVRPLQLA